MRMAQALEVAPIPEGGVVTAVRDDVIDVGGRGPHAVVRALRTPRFLP
jgi:hypothetical protein